METSGVCSNNSLAEKDFSKVGGVQSFGPKNVDAKPFNILDQPNK